MRALEFDGDAVLKIGEKNHIIAIFVGTLMKQYKDGTQFLSGTAACRWYINENDIPAIKVFQRRYTLFLLQLLLHVHGLLYIRLIAFFLKLTRHQHG
jgi:hypothetical protein